MFRAADDKVLETGEESENEEQVFSFHLDKIKIDRTFVSRLNDSDEGKVIVRAILGLAKGFGLAATAEGVEDAAQLAYLKANGSTEGQGYLFGKAMPAADIPALLNDLPLRRRVGGRSLVLSGA
jgi:EAL domain-containing protein (putative c-di-GMP-specific phosphodiesterase class I)